MPGTGDQVFYFSGIFLLILAQSAQAKFMPVKIATGSDYTCVLSSEGEIKCWGSNDNHQLGTGDKYSYGFYQHSMGNKLPSVNLGANIKAVDICAGESFTCAATTEGKVKCWGYSYNGILGPNSDVHEMGDALPFIDLGTGIKVKNLACGMYHVCAMTSGGGAKCWGSNVNGQLAIGDQNDRGVEAKNMGDHLPFLPTERPILSMGGGFAHTCALFEDGVKCVGRDEDGQLGEQAVRDAGATPVTAGMKNIPPLLFEVPGVKIKIRKLTSGEKHNCVLYEKDGKDHVKCWGKVSNWAGERLLEVNLGFEKVVDIQSHLGFACALGEIGKLKCWGSDSVLGSVDSAERDWISVAIGKSPPEIDLDLPIRTLSVGSGSSHSCAILINNEIKCWGYGGYGQLGYEDGFSHKVLPAGRVEFLPFVNFH